MSAHENNCSQKKRCWIVGIVCGLILLVIVAGSLYLAKESNQQENATNVFVEAKHVESKLEDIDKCWLCGNADRSLMGYFRKFDDLGIICVNNWYVMAMKIRNYDEDGKYISTGDGGNNTYTGTSEGDCFFESAPMSNRGLSKVTIRYGEDSTFDANKIKSDLCQPCLDKVVLAMGSYKNKTEKAAPWDLCLVDFRTLEIYPLQDYNISYLIRDYYVQIESSEAEKQVIAFYAPELKDGEK